MVDHPWSADKTAHQSFNPTRLTLARERNGLTKQQLADACQVTRRAVSAWEAGEVENPPIAALARVLGFPELFFYADDPVPLSEDGVSFRALKSMSARQLDRVLAAGSMAIEFSAWMNSNYTTPVPDLPDLSDSQCLEPSLAAESVRSIWGVHQAAVRNLLLLLEEKGVRVFSLPVSDHEVDAFSFWHEDRPFIFLDTARTSERMRFDLAHELGHLLLHRQTKSLRSRNVEQQAQDFASSFLIPADGLYAQVKGQLRLEDVFELKRFWRVSAVAMVQRLWHLSIISDWHYRTWMVELSRRGFRTSEPGGIRPETSRLYRELFKLAREDGWSVKRIALALHIPEKEIDGMVFGLAIVSAPPDTPASGQLTGSQEFGRLTRAK